MTEFDAFLDTPPAQHILSLMCFQLGHDAQFWRAFGADVPKKAEAEQAYMMTRLLKLAAVHGDKWHDAYMAEKRARLEPLEAIGRALRFLGPSDEELMPCVDVAASRWVASKEREFDQGQIEYFTHNWRALPGLRDCVLAEHKRRSKQANGD